MLNKCSDSLHFWSRFKKQEEGEDFQIPHSTYTHNDNTHVHTEYHLLSFLSHYYWFPSSAGSSCWLGKKTCKKTFSQQW